MKGFKEKCCDNQKLIGLGCFQKSEYYTVTTFLCVNCLTEHVIEDFPESVEVLDEDWKPDEEELKIHQDDLWDWFNEQLSDYEGYLTEMMPYDEREAYEAEGYLEGHVYETEPRNPDEDEQFQNMLDDYLKELRDEGDRNAEEESYYEVIKMQINHLKYSHVEHLNCIMKNHLTEYKKIYEIHFENLF